MKGYDMGKKKTVSTIGGGKAKEFVRVMTMGMARCDLKEFLEWMCIDADSRETYLAKKFGADMEAKIKFLDWWDMTSIPTRCRLEISPHIPAVADTVIRNTPWLGTREAARFFLEVAEETLELLIKLEKEQKAAISLQANAALAVLHKQATNLAGGRAKGAQAQKEHAAKTREIVEQLNNDLLDTGGTAYRHLEQRADYITKYLLEVGRMQPNGNPYKTSTIYRMITGT